MRGVTLRLASGEVHGDALIGADGVHSRIREALFGPDRPRFTGYMAWRGTIPMEKLPVRMRRLIGTNWIGPGSHVVQLEAIPASACFRSTQRFVDTIGRVGIGFNSFQKV